MPGRTGQQPERFTRNVQDRNHPPRWDGHFHGHPRNPRGRGALRGHRGGQADQRKARRYGPRDGGGQVTAGLEAPVAYVGALGDTRPWASYARKSKRTKGDGAGALLTFARQHEENLDRLHSVHPGVRVVEFQDNMSAWNEDVARPDWERLLVELADGKYAGVIGWHSDRFTRQPIQLEYLFRACRQGRTQLWTARSGHVTDETMLRIEGALAASESNQKAARLVSRHRQIAKSGGFHGGKRRFGYHPSMTLIRKDEAVVVRELFHRLL